MLTMKRVKRGNVASPLAFTASGLWCGIKRSHKKRDLSLVFSETPCVAAASFTTNDVKAWPVLYSEKAIRNKKHRIIIGTSGNANCFNGEEGKNSVDSITDVLSELLDVDNGEILIAQTGVIGREFPIARVISGLPKLVSFLSRKGGNQAAKGILTTDKRTKEIAVSTMIDGKKITVGGMAKGSGMVHPNMATLLAFLTTDANISKKLLSKALKEGVERSFNCITIDNDLSTNDTAFILANGAADNKKITSQKSDAYKAFSQAVNTVLIYLAKEIVKDGEGVTKICEIDVRGAANNTEAYRASRMIGDSMLFKTMILGADPNWGRIIGALGASKVKAKWDKLDVSFDGIKILSDSKEESRNRKKLRQVMKKKEFRLEIDLKAGKGRAVYWTSDLTKRYIDINAHYTT